MPASIRDSSRTRSPSSRTVSPEVVTVPSLDLATTTWRSAYAATWGRWVTTSDLGVAGQRWPAAGRPRRPPCRRPRRRPRRRRTSGPWSCRPGTPRAPSITRESSPPDAPLCRGRGSAPVLAASRNSTSSTPEAVKRSQRSPPAAGAGLVVVRGRLGLVLPHGQRTRACGIASSPSSRVTAAPSASAVRVRAADRASAARPSSARRRVRRSRSSLTFSSVWSRSSSRRDDCSDQASTSSMVSPYFRVSAISAARRSETAASRAGSVSSREA